MKIPENLLTPSNNPNYLAALEASENFVRRLYSEHDHQFQQQRYEYKTIYKREAPQTRVNFHTWFKTEYDFFRERYDDFPDKIYIQLNQLEFERFLTGDYKVKHKLMTYEGAYITGIWEIPVARVTRYPVLNRKAFLIEPSSAIPTAYEYKSVDIHPGNFPEDGIVLAFEDETFLQAFARVGGNDGIRGLAHLDKLDEVAALEVFKGLDQNVLSLNMLGFPEIGKKALEFQAARGLKKLRLARELKEILNERH